MNKEGKRLIEYIKKRSMVEYRGIRGDKKGNWTYTGVEENLL